MTPDDLIAEIEAAIALQEDAISRYRIDNPEPDDPIHRVYAGGDLQGALDQGGIIEIMDAGAAFERARFVIPQSNTELRGNNARLFSSSGPALWVPPGVNNVQVRDLYGATSVYQTVFELGKNDRETQGTLELVPRGIVFERVHVPTHRQKRGFEVNCAGRFVKCDAVDVYNTVIVDSQAMSIMNTPGPIEVDGGEWSAASECIMVGGDSMKIPNCTPTNLTFKNLHLFKPLSWRTDQIRRGVKNLFELKSGSNVLLQDSLLENTWTDAQQSCAIVITPRNGLNISNVAIDRCSIRNVGLGLNIMGVNDATPHNTSPTDLVAVRNSTFLIDHRLWGSSGFFAQILNNQWGAVGEFSAENCYVSASAGYYVMFSLQAGYVTAGDPPVKTPIPTNRIRLLGNRMYVPFYNNGSQWFHSGSAPLKDAVKTIEITDTVIGAGSTLMKQTYPNNQYITEAEFKLLPQTPPLP
ncbi:MAG: hypothetical protein ABWY78_06345 [Microvirga sp.]